MDMASKLCTLAALMAYARAEGGYNMIDALPACMEGDVCPYASPGGYDAIHPNAEERVVYTLRNIARLYPEEFRTTKWGLKTGGGSWTYKRTSDSSNCGTQADDPSYWHTGANQVTRFHVWSSSICPSGGPGHFTCPEWCYLFVNKGFEESSACGMKARNVEMVTNLQYDCNWWEGNCDAANPGNEGLWWYGAYYSSEAHCGLIFNPEYTFHGFGFWPGWNSVTNIGVKLGPYMTYPLVTGMHMDTRGRMYNPDPVNYVSFMVLFSGDRIGNDKVSKAYLLYQTSAYPMSLEIGTTQKGFWVVDVAPKAACAPYAFVVVTTSGDTYRLPQDENYFFGTAWTPGVDQLECFENHYHKLDSAISTWRPNEADNISGNDIVDCIGCDDCTDLAFIYSNDAMQYYAFEPPVSAELTGNNDNVNYVSECGTTGCFLDFADCVSIGGGKVDIRISGDYYRDPELYFNKQPVYRNDNDIDDDDDDLYLFYSFESDFFGTSGTYKWVVDNDLGGSGSGFRQSDDECSSEDVTQCSWGTECTLPPAECGDYQCLEISGGDSTINGVWQVTYPECINDRSVYTREGAADGPYLCHNEQWNSWIVSNDVCQNDDDSIVAQCARRRHDPFFCTGDAWGTSGSVSMSDCGGGLAYEFEEALGMYAEAVLLSKGEHNTRLWSEDAETDAVVRFEYYDEVEWSHNAPVYRFADTEDVFYLHFYDNGTAGTGRWMVSRNGYLYDESMDFAVAWCLSDTLGECVAGAWTAVNESEQIVSVEWGNDTREIATSVRDVYVDNEMAVVLEESESGNGADEEDDGSDIEVIAAVVLVLAAVVCCFVVGRRLMRQKAGPKGVQSFEAHSPSYHEQEVEVEAEQVQTEEMVQFEAVRPDAETTCAVST